MVEEGRAEAEAKAHVDRLGGLRVLLLRRKGTFYLCVRVREFIFDWRGSIGSNRFILFLYGTK